MRPQAPGRGRQVCWLGDYVSWCFVCEDVWRSIIVFKDLAVCDWGLG